MYILSIFCAYYLLSVFYTRSLVVRQSSRLVLGGQMYVFRCTVAFVSCIPLDKASRCDVNKAHFHVLFKLSSFGVCLLCLAFSDVSILSIFTKTVVSRHTDQLLYNVSKSLGISNKNKSKVSCKKRTRKIKYTTCLTVSQTVTENIAQFEKKTTQKRRRNLDYLRT